MEGRQLEVGFLKSAGPEIDSAFGVPSHLNVQRTTFSSKEPIYQLDNALKHYRTLDCGNVTAFDTGKCTWDDVFGLLAEAKGQYQAKEKGFQGAFVSMARKAGDHADAVTPTLQLIPEEFGLGILRASLCWMFVLLKKAAKKRVKILEAFEDIPRIITIAELKKFHFSHDMVLKDLVDGLNDVVIEALTKFIAYLLPKHQVAKLFPIFSKVPSVDDVDMMIEKVEKAVLNMKERSEILSEALLVDIHEQNSKHHGKVEAALNVTRATAAATSAGLHTVSRQVSQIEDAVQPMPQKMDLLQNSVSELREEIVTSERAIIDGVTAMGNSGALNAQNWMFAVLTEMRQGFETRFTAIEEKQDRLLRGAAQLLELEQLGSQASRLLPSSQQPLLEPKQLLEILAVPFEALTRDLDYVVRQGLHLSPTEQGQAQLLMKMDRFWTWFTSMDSDMLFVGGSLMDPSQHQLRISSLSVVCATIVASIAHTNSDAIALHYFCGLHLSSNDALRGPRGLMRCLTSRLLVELQGKYSVVPNLDFLDANSIDRLRYHNSEQLCDLFCRLVMNFPPNVTIYCIIDGICWFERQEMLEELFKAMQSLHAMVGDPGKRATLKVLLTSPFRSRHIAQGLHMQNKITLQAEPLLLAGVVETWRFGRPEPSVMVRPPRQRMPSQEEEWTIEDYE